MWLNDGRGGFVHGNVAPEGVGVFLRVTGESTRSVALAGNALLDAGADRARARGGRGGYRDGAAGGEREEAVSVICASRRRTAMPLVSVRPYKFTIPAR